MTFRKLLKKIIPQNLLYAYKYYNEYHSRYGKLLDKIEITSNHGIVYVLEPAYSNLGDVAIYVKSLEFLRMCNIPLKAVLYSKQCVNKNIFKILPLYDDDIIVIQGGGNMGAVYASEEMLRQNIVKWFPNNPIISMPQTIWFGKEKHNYILDRAKKIYSNHKNLTICARDYPSAEFCTKNFSCKSLLCPDMVLSSVPARTIPYKKNKRVMLCLRKDLESSLKVENSEYLEKLLLDKDYLIEYFDTDKLSGKNIEDKDGKIAEILKYFESFEFVITDRYHGTIMSYITKTPCIALDNSYGKVKNGFIWFKNSNYMFYADAIDDVLKYIEKIELLKEWNSAYQLKNYFEALKRLLHD